MSTICKNCGATVSDDETHCPYCDSPIESPIKLQAERFPSEETYSLNNYNSENNPINEIKSVRLIELAIISFLIPIVGLVLYLVTKETDYDAAEFFSALALIGLAFVLIILPI